MIPADKLHQLEIFKDLPLPSLEKLGVGMEEKKFPSGAMILKEGEKSGALYVIASGSVSIQKKLDKAGDKSKIVARFAAGEFFGEMSLLGNQAHSASVVAEGATTIFILPRQALDQLIEKDATTAVNHVLTLMAGISSRLRQTTRELVTVFEVARLMGRDASLVENLTQVLKQLQVALGESVGVGFYRWNYFNDEYELLVSEQIPGEGFFDATLPKDSSAVNQKNRMISKVEHLKNPEGLFMYASPHGFDGGAKQLIETVASMLAPTLASARVREEEMAKQRLERNKQKERFHI